MSGASHPCDDDVLVATGWMNAGEMKLDALITSAQALTPSAYYDPMRRLEYARDLFLRAGCYELLPPCLVLLGRTYRRALFVHAAKEAFEKAACICTEQGMDGTVLVNAHMCLGSLHQSLAYEAAEGSQSGPHWEGARHHYETALLLMEASGEAPSSILPVLLKLGNACLWLHLYDVSAQVFGTAVKMCAVETGSTQYQKLAEVARTCADALYGQ